MTALRQTALVAVNVLLIVDMAGNCLLLGRPGETISHRVARLRLHGGPKAARIGCWVCMVLTRAFWFMRRDHCVWALQSQGYSGVELWRWSK